MSYYENQTEDEAVVEDETVLANQTLIQVPTELVPDIIALIAKYKTSSAQLIDGVGIVH